MKKILILLILLSTVLFTGCNNTAISISDSKSYTQQNLEEGDSYISESNQTILTTSNYYIGGITKNISLCMQQRQIIAQSDDTLDLVINLYEGGTFSGGTLIQNFNKERNYIDNSTFEIYKDVTVIDLGLKLPFESFVFGDKRIKTSTENFVSYIMKKNTTYILEIKNNGIKSADTIFVWNWFEYCSQS